MGYVGQEPTVFARSIRENITYGLEGITEEQINEAVKMANAQEYATLLLLPFFSSIFIFSLLSFPFLESIPL